MFECMSKDGLLRLQSLAFGVLFSVSDEDESIIKGILRTIFCSLSWGKRGHEARQDGNDHSWCCLRGKVGHVRPGLVISSRCSESTISPSATNHLIYLLIPLIHLKDS